MTDPSYSRYLSAKRSVDGRALNWQVVQRLRAELRGSAGQRLRIVELGSGLGTMVARLLELQMIVQAEYLLLDLEAGALAETRRWLVEWAEATKLAVLQDDHSLRIRGESGIDVGVTFVHAALADLLAEAHRPAPADLLIASGYLDRVDVPAVLSDLFALLVSEGLFCFTLNFDGETIFQPDHPDDAMVAQVHRRSPAEGGRRAGDSRCGRHLFGHLTAAGAMVLAAGASDGIVHPQGGRYPNDEAHFLERVLDNLGTESRQHADLPRERLDAWLGVRRQQLARGELVYLVRQLDFVGRRPPVRAA